MREIGVSLNLGLYKVQWAFDEKIEGPMFKTFVPYSLVNLQASFMRAKQVLWPNRLLQANHPCMSKRTIICLLFHKGFTP